MPSTLAPCHEDASRELGERSARLERTEARIRGLIIMQAEGDRSPMAAEMRRDLEAHAYDEHAAITDLSAEAKAPIRLPPSTFSRGASSRSAL